MTSKASLQERREFLKNKVNPILEVMIADLMKERPEKVVEFMATWINSKGKSVETKLQGSKEKRPEGVESSEEEDDDVEDIPVKKNQGKGPRQSVSAEAFGKFNQKKAYKPKIIHKEEKTIKRIEDRLSNAFMFQAQDDRDKDIVIGAMEEVKFKKGDFVIKQGDDGDVQYVVDSGSQDCTKVFSPGADETYLKTYQPGESFGELALLYNAPRAATIKAKDDSVLFSLDRACFNNIVKESAMKKRIQYETFLSKVSILESQDSYEKTKICDCLQSMKFKPGDYIIREGEYGNTFFLVEEGTAQALKKTSEGTEKVVFEYQDNDYFGELALLRDEPRAASIRATSNLRVAHIDRLSFKRILGPLEKILERNADRYAKFMKDKGILN